MTLIPSQYLAICSFSLSISCILTLNSFRCSIYTISGESNEVLIVSGIWDDGIARDEWFYGSWGLGMGLSFCGVSSSKDLLFIFWVFSSCFFYWFLLIGLGLFSEEISVSLIYKVGVEIWGWFIVFVLILKLFLYTDIIGVWFLLKSLINYSFKNLFS